MERALEEETVSEKVEEEKATVAVMAMEGGEPYQAGTKE